MSIIYLKSYPLILLAVLLVSAVSQLLPAGRASNDHRTHAGKSARDGDCDVPAVSEPRHHGRAADRCRAGIGLLQSAVLGRGAGRADLQPDRSDGAARGRRAAASTSAEREEHQPRSGYLALLEDWRFLVFLVAFLLLCVVYSQYTAALPLAIVRSGLSTWWYGAVVTLNALMVVTFEVVATKWVQAWPLRLTQMSGFALLAVGYGIYAIDIAPVFLILGTLVWTLSEIIGAPTVYAYPGMVAPARLRGRYFGAMQSMFGLGSTLGPILGIAAYDRFGQQMFLWTALVAVLATVIGRIGMRGRATPESTEREPQPASAESAG